MDQSDHGRHKKRTNRQRNSEEEEEGKDQEEINKAVLWNGKVFSRFKSTCIVFYLGRDFLSG